MAGPIDDFLSIYPKSGTRRVYRSALRAFLDFVYGRQREDRMRSVPAGEVAGLYEDLAARYLADDRDRAADLIRFAGTSTDAPTTTQTRAAAVLEFLGHHGIDLSDRDRRRIRGKLPRGGAVTRRGDVTHEMLRRIAGHLDEHGRALVLVLASSGMRIGEAVTVRLADLDLEASPAAIEIRSEYSKNRVGRVDVHQRRGRVRGPDLARRPRRLPPRCRGPGVRLHHAERPGRPAPLPVQHHHRRGCLGTGARRRPASTSATSAPAG